MADVSDDRSATAYPRWAMKLATRAPQHCAVVQWIAGRGVLRTLTRLYAECPDMDQALAQIEHPAALSADDVQALRDVAAVAQTQCSVDAATDVIQTILDEYVRCSQDAFSEH